MHGTPFICFGSTVTLLMAVLPIKGQGIFRTASKSIPPPLRSAGLALEKVLRNFFGTFFRCEDEPRAVLDAQRLEILSPPQLWAIPVLTPGP